KTSQSDIVGTVQFVSATSIKITFDLTLAAPGTWDLLLTNPDHGTTTCAACFTVAGNTPTVTSADPDTLGRGANAVDVVLTGTNFANGATVTISGTGVTAGTAVATSGTTLTVPITVTSSATLGARNITVTNTDSLQGVCTSCLTIAPGPTATSVSTEQPSRCRDLTSRSARSWLIPTPASRPRSPSSRRRPRAPGTWSSPTPTSDAPPARAASPFMPRRRSHRWTRLRSARVSATRTSPSPAPALWIRPTFRSAAPR
ncbi:MAG: hypothetical protein E6G68_05065, partial [Actinobacteria bacterium]